MVCHDDRWVKGAPSEHSYFCQLRSDHNTLCTHISDSKAQLLQPPTEGQLFPPSHSYIDRNFQPRIATMSSVQQNRRSTIKTISRTVLPARSAHIALPVAAIFSYCTTRTTFSNGPVTAFLLPLLLYLYARTVASRVAASGGSWCKLCAILAALTFTLGYTAVWIDGLGYECYGVASGFANTFLIHVSIARLFFRVPFLRAWSAKIQQAARRRRERQLETEVLRAQGFDTPNEDSKIILALAALIATLTQSVFVAAWQVLVLRFVCHKLNDGNGNVCLAERGSWTGVYFATAIRVFVLVMGPGLWPAVALGASLYVLKAFHGFRGGERVSAILE